ncbi:ADP/ATP translocating protein [Gluconobacter thailandicus]|uniref:NTP/NDP exchange transporter n=1 Tax=Gluconobacter thailandicus TaxID=257438 RepID=UPI000777CF02|nr:MFS transporter [Gluconobacter thailandicus]KXV34794.1 ADP/ATP translocating protein [Gluconobacter thailandicus]
MTSDNEHLIPTLRDTPAEPAANSGWRGWLIHAINARPDEIGAVLWGFTLFFLLFTSYAILRPVRDAMGIASGVRNLQWLFSATFVTILVAVPIYGWLNAHVARVRFIDWVYGFFAINMLGFAAFLTVWPASSWIARAFFVWLSVFNLFVMSVAWSLMADLFDTGQAKRLFGFIAGGVSIGGIAGPVFAALMVSILSIPGLLVVSALLLYGAVLAKSQLMTWRSARDPIQEDDERQRPVLGNPFSGFTLVVRSPYLLCLAAFVLLLTTATTFLYFEQARLVVTMFPARSAQVRIFSIIDGCVQTLSLICQMFVTGRFARYFGLKGLLTAVPLMIVAGFLALAVWPTFAVIATVMGVRRVGEYAFIRPGREMLFARMPVNLKYRAKNFLDTVVYRAGDVVSGWASAAITTFSQSSVVVSLVGALLAIIWAAFGYVLGEQEDKAGETTGRLRGN